jgi:DNA topoisomerase-3
MQVTVMFQKMVTSDGTLKIADVSVKEECKTHPSGLNMLKVP